MLDNRRKRQHMYRHGSAYLLLPQLTTCAITPERSGRPEQLLACSEPSILSVLVGTLTTEDEGLLTKTGSADSPHSPRPTLRLLKTVVNVHGGC